MHQIGHQSYVAPLAHIPEGLFSQLPQGGVVSGNVLPSCWPSLHDIIPLLQHDVYSAGSRDNTLRVWDVETAQAVQILQGHQYQVRACDMLLFVPTHWLYDANPEYVNLREACLC